MYFDRRQLIIRVGSVTYQTDCTFRHIVGQVPTLTVFHMMCIKFDMDLILACTAAENHLRQFVSCIDRLIGLHSNTPISNNFQNWTFVKNLMYLIIQQHLNNMFKSQHAYSKQC